MSFLPKKLPVLHRSSRPEITRQITSMSLTNKGLLNPTGHNNCFLNSCVQVLWHVDVFRRSFREFKGHTCIGNSCIFCALQALFTQFQHSSQSALPPDDLREALAHCYQEQHRFQLGIMDDAAECFEKILEQIHFHLTGSEDLDSCSAPHCLPHQKCALSVLEMTECTCGETSEPLAFVQFVHYISAPSLGAAAKKKKKEASYSLGDGGLFGELVRSVSGEGEGRECATCHRVSPLRKMLLNSPDLVCVGMIWDSEQPGVDDIMSVVESVGTILRVSDVFHRVMSDASSTEYWLCGMVAYYGHHYCTFCYHTVLRQWGFFDDANFRTVSSNWSDVVELCRKAHYQPLLLVYTNPFAEKIAMTTAPTTVTRATDTKPASLPPLTEEPAAQGAQNQSLSESKQEKSTEQVKAVPSTAPGTKPSTKPSSTQATSSSITSAPEPKYEIDTFSIRPVTGERTSTLYPQLSEGFSVEEEAVPVPSAPPLQTQSSSQQPKTIAPFVFQSSTIPPARPNQARGSTPLFPVQFQAAPTQQAQGYGGFTRPPLSQYNYPPPQGAGRPHQHYQYSQPPTSQPIRQPYSVQGGYRPTNVYTGGYPQPTHPQRLPTQANPQLYSGYRYPNTSRQTSPWRGEAGLGGNLSQAHASQAGPQSFLHQSSPQMSPQPPTTQPTPAQQAKKHGTQPHPSLPSSPTKHLSCEQRASSMQPQVTTTIARPRPSPPRSVPPPEKIDTVYPATNNKSGAANKRDDLIEFSFSPALLSPTNRDASPQRQASPLHPPSSDSSTILSSSSREGSSSREVSPYRPDGVSSAVSSEEGGDLIQWSLNPDMIQRVQKYRGRQGIRQGSVDSISHPVKRGTDRATDGARQTEAVVVEAVGKTVTATKQAKNSTSEPVHERCSEHSEGKVKTIEEVVSHEGEVGRENSDLPPDPLYADPDTVQTMLKTTPTTIPSTTSLNQPSIEATSNTTTQPPREPSSGEREERPAGLGEDPLYAVPEQVVARMRAKNAVTGTQSSENGVDTSTTSHSDIPASVEPLLREALDTWRKAESKRHSDLPLAKMNYSRAATLLMKVVLDPAVAKDQTLRQNILTRRQEALDKCSHMNDLLEKRLSQRSSEYGGDGACCQCGQFRQLNTHQMCGPCHLKNKINRN